jgi:fructose-1,6-bisphosphatase/sedoheptulose 1,7-bisphosphatase-like protein
MKNFHLDLIRVTEAGAISAAEWVGRGEKEAADKAATEAMRDRLNTIDFLAEIAIGEGKKDHSFGLFAGELVGLGASAYRNSGAPATPQLFGDQSSDHAKLPGPAYSIALDPIEGTTPTAKGGYEAMSVIALANHGSFFTTEHFYMNKLAVGPAAIKLDPMMPDLRRSVEENITWVAAALGKSINHLTACVLDRPRHTGLVNRLRAMGCRIKFIADCDVTACIATCVKNSGIDIYMGVGGAPEAVIAAAAMRCMKGKFQAQLVNAEGAPVDDRVFEMKDLAAGDVMFAATGITDGQLLRGVRFTDGGPVTHSIAMRSESRTIRKITTEHGN